LTLNELLDVKYLGAWDWSPDDRWLAYLWDDGGKVDLWLVESAGGTPPRKLTSAKGRVSGFDWNPADGSLLVAMDKDLWLASPDDIDDGGGGGWFSLQPLTQTRAVEAAPSWSPQGRVAAFVRDQTLWLYDFEAQVAREVAVNGTVAQLAFGPGPALNWSPGGEMLCFRFMDEDKVVQIAVASPQGELLWQTARRGKTAANADWLSEKDLFYGVSAQGGMAKDFYRVDLAFDSGAAEGARDYKAIGVPTPLHPRPELVYTARDATGRGTARMLDFSIGPQGRRVLLHLEDDGWYHHYLLDVGSGKAQQLTFGQCEDLAHAGDAVAWSPDGARFIYASNRNSPRERHLWLYDLEAGAEVKLLEFPVTNAQPRWSHRGDRIVFTHCDVHRPLDLWVVDLPGGGFPPELPTLSPQDCRQLTNSLPDTWTEAKYSLPQHITYKGALDWDIDGFLVKPKDFDAGKRYPALVWVHGGPIRQLRGSWHPLRSYALFYGFNQYLAHQGYVTLSINFRGGIGYGRDFRNALYHKMGVDDLEDVVKAGRYLKGLPFVDPDLVGVYGLSYGGYMTLHALTQYPDEFALGVNIAGIWDFAQWTRWIESRYGKQGGLFKTYFGGAPEESPELYSQGSPVTFKEGLKRPLINFHGTADANVDFAQMDRIVKDCIKMGKDYEAYYYPDEVHTFARRETWQDAFTKMVREFDRYLK